MRMTGIPHTIIAVHSQGDGSSRKWIPLYMRVPALSRLDLELRSDMGLATEEPRIIEHTRCDLVLLKVVHTSALRRIGVTGCHRGSRVRWSTSPTRIDMHSSAS
jgi:hypothetical protein